MRKLQKNINDIIGELRTWVQDSNLTQMEISERTKVNQATISRLTNVYSTRKKMTKPLYKLCNYAKIDIYEGERPHPAENAHLMDALEYAWDGSPEHAKRLAKVIRLLKCD